MCVAHVFVSCTNTCFVCRISVFINQSLSAPLRMVSFLLKIHCLGTYPWAPPCSSIVRGWGVWLRAQSALHKTSGRSIFKWVSLRWCAQKYLGAINLFCQAQPQTWLPGGSWVCRGIGTQSPRSIQEYALATANAIRPLTQPLTCKMSSSVFAAKSWLKVASMTWASLTIIP